MVFSLVKRMVRALGGGFVRLGRCWAAQFGVVCTPAWASDDAAHLALDQVEEEHWDWSIPYLWYETSR
ncbi:hypothetical protein AB0O28_33500 [Microbispora sp. NPDC088329]|uniref:hypothetical protein n=1 Tax=Microbispora sp. NPDC088329 TaxID=3154869 RepID=UPI0034313CB4